MANQYQPPIKVTIAIPLAEPRKKGPFGTTAGANFRLRCSEDEYALIHREANLLGIKGAMFARASAVRVALALKKHREEESTSDEAELDGTRR